MWDGISVVSLEKQYVGRAEAVILVAAQGIFAPDVAAAQRLLIVEGDTAARSGNRGRHSRPQVEGAEPLRAEDILANSGLEAAEGEAAQMVEIVKGFP